MKKVLIIAYSYYPPVNRIGAIRPHKLAKFFLQNNYTVHVITSNKNLENKHFNSNMINYDITRINHSKKFIFFNRFFEKNKTKINNENIKTDFNFKEKNKEESFVIKKIKLFMHHFIKLFRSIDFYKQFKKEYKKNKQLYKEYDVVISTYSPLGNHLCGKFIKKKQKNIIWIADFRDPMITRFNSTFFFTNYLKRKQNSFCKNADYISTVSEGFLNRIVNKRYLYKSQVITNSYDLDDKPIDLYDYTKFSFTYAGALYGSDRNLLIFFRCLSMLINEGFIDKNDLELNYAGVHFNEFATQAKQYGLLDVVNNHGLLSREAVLELQTKSRYLLLLTWNYNNETGVLPGKFFEYLLFNKPIVTIVNGDLPNSEIKSIIENGKFGFCYEEANHQSDFDSLIEYIKMEYLKFKKNDKNYYNPNKNVLDSYNYLNNYKKFEDFLKQN